MKFVFLLGMFFFMKGGFEVRYENLELQVDVSSVRHAVVTWPQPMFLLNPSLRLSTEMEVAVVHDSVPISYRDWIVDTAPHDGLDPPCRES